MVLRPSSVLLRGGLDLITPAMAMPAGRAIAAMNYEPEARGYRRIGGYERFDGRPSPSLGANAQDIAARRAAIRKVPGIGPVRGVYVYAGALYAFRDNEDGQGAMWRSTMTGWRRIMPGHVMRFTGGSVEIVEGNALVGETSSASAIVRRVVVQSGVWDGSAAGYLVLSDIVGEFTQEAVTDVQGGRVNARTIEPITISPGGRYDLMAHNFYGAARRRRLYGANGVGKAFEFDGETYHPIETGNQAGTLDDVVAIVTRANATIVSRTGATIIARGEYDRPAHIGQYSNHLFLTFDAGSLMHSGVGEPLDFRTSSGAGEIGFGTAPTGLLSSVSTSLVIFGQSRIEYLVGTDQDTFEMRPISDAAGAARWSTQQGGETPIYLDEGGLRKLSTTAAFGDWTLGTLSQLVEPLFRAKRDAGVAVAASLVAKAKDQVRLFWNDGSGIILYLGREAPEIMPIRFPTPVFSACSGEFREGEGERMFVGSTDGYVYELDKGPSFDGASVPAYVRLAWNSERQPMLEKRFQSARIETDSLSPMSIGIAYAVDYSMGDNLAGELRSYAIPAGSLLSNPADAPYGSIDWTVAMSGEIHADDLSGLGRNIALTIVSDHTTEDPHTLAALTMFYAARRQLR
ncbi:hypothetical protein DYI37_03885 [Fulvimarina endophytica]|uniref:Uncharacterized protein n=1 Tax=Fulvimarina endophytica TaxID=2293836 RepID=A0A371X720_9HYPH|nr:hypothetical protein [Fulvimarina endophytica]RFC65016.1 hypothetical protein DYI37_03885 [Fulvimarina endophytica]